MLISMTMTESSKNMDLYVPRVIKDNYKRSFSYMDSNLWNKVGTDVKNLQLLGNLNKIIIIQNTDKITSLGPRA